MKFTSRHISVGTKIILVGPSGNKENFFYVFNLGNHRPQKQDQSKNGINVDRNLIEKRFTT